MGNVSKNLVCVPGVPSTITAKPYPTSCGWLHGLDDAIYAVRDRMYGQVYNRRVGRKGQWAKNRPNL